MSNRMEFRVYHPRHGMYEVAALDFAEDVVVALDREAGSHVEHRWFGGEVELMQHVGLHDDEGTRIFEGDVLEVKVEEREQDRPSDEFRGPVEYSPSTAQFGVRLGSQLMGFDRIRESSVLGNIHENPDLLE